MLGAPWAAGISVELSDSRRGTACRAVLGGVPPRGWERDPTVSSSAGLWLPGLAGSALSQAPRPSRLQPSELLHPEVLAGLLPSVLSVCLGVESTL